MFVLLAVMTTTAVAEDWTITPGQGVGPIKLGMKLSEVETSSKALPQGTGILTRKGVLTGPKAGKPNVKEIKYTKYGGLDVQWDPRAVSINILKPTMNVSGRSVRLVGPAGLTVGSPLSAVQQAMGQWDEAEQLKPTKNMCYVYRSKGIYFVVNGNKVESISVIQKK